jgi:hypothetical protein
VGQGIGRFQAASPNKGSQGGDDACHGGRWRQLGSVAAADTLTSVRREPAIALAAEGAEARLRTLRQKD